MVPKEGNSCIFFRSVFKSLAQNHTCTSQILKEENVLVFNEFEPILPGPSVFSSYWTLHPMTPADFTHPQYCHILKWIPSWSNTVSARVGGFWCHSLRHLSSAPAVLFESIFSVNKSTVHQVDIQNFTPSLLLSQPRLSLLLSSSERSTHKMSN